MTAGTRTTEFVLALCACLFGAALSGLGFALSRDSAVYAGAGVLAVVAAAYGMGRSRVKAGDAPTPHEREVAAALRSPHRVP